MKKILFTAARAPATLDIIRNLSVNGHQTYCADSLQYPIAKQTKHLTKYYKISSPLNDLKQYTQELLDIIQSHQIDYLLPTCEEVFYIAMIKEELSPFCTVLCEDIEHLKKLHSKHDVYLKMHESINAIESMQAPKTVDISTGFNGDNIDLSQWVLKKEYSRFGNDVIISPNLKQVESVIESSCRQNRVLLQQKITGQEICCYAYAYQGNLTILVNYLPKYRLKKSASVYFEVVDDPTIKAFVEHYVQTHQFTGQISFDFIRQDQAVYLIECNPRTVSGVHFCRSISLFDHLINKKGEFFTPIVSAKTQVALAMILLIFPQKIISLFSYKTHPWRNLKQTYCDYKQAKDVLHFDGDYGNTLYQLKSLYEIICIALKHRCSLQAASTQDLEWDGKDVR